MLTRPFDKDTDLLELHLEALGFSRIEYWLLELKKQGIISTQLLNNKRSLSLYDLLKAKSSSDNEKLLLCQLLQINVNHKDMLSASSNDLSKVVERCNSVATQGILLTSDVEKVLQERSCIIKYPEKGEIAIENHTREVVKKLTSLTEEKLFKQAMGLLGYGLCDSESVSNTLFNKINVEDEKEHYASTIRYTSICFMKISYDISQIELTTEAKDGLQSITKCFELNKCEFNDDIYKACAHFFQLFGSHITIGPLQYGVSMLWACSSRNLKDKEKDLVLKMQSEVVASTSDDPKRAGIDKDSYKGICSQKILNDTSLTNEIFAGPATITSLQQWERECKSRSDYWMITDRGQTVPVWEFLRLHCQNECIEIIDVLKKSWEKMTGLKASTDFLFPITMITTIAPPVCDNHEQEEAYSKSTSQDSCSAAVADIAIGAALQVLGENTSCSSEYQGSKTSITPSAPNVLLKDDLPVATKNIQSRNTSKFSLEHLTTKMPQRNSKNTKEKQFMSRSDPIESTKISQVASKPSKFSSTVAKCKAFFTKTANQSTGGDSTSSNTKTGSHTDHPGIFNKHSCDAASVTCQNEVLQLLGLDSYYYNKIKLKDALCIRSDVINISVKNESSLINIKNLPFVILHKIMSYDINCRSDLLSPSQKKCEASSHRQRSDEEDYIESDDEDEQNGATRMHPMDCLHALLLCCDDLLRQDLFSRLAKCQLSVPFLMPDPVKKTLILPLWAMRSIIKEWTPRDQQLQSHSIVTYPMPIISFIRFGNNKMNSFSKSKILNLLLSDLEKSPFFQYGCSGGQYPRIFSEGLVDMSWYLPSGKCNDTFDDVIAILNLHGDAHKFPLQTEILTKISSVCFIVITDKEFRFKGHDMKMLQKLYDTPMGLQILNGVEKHPGNSLKKVYPNSQVINLTKKHPTQIKEALKKRIKFKLGQIEQYQCLDKTTGNMKFNKLEVDENDEIYKLCFQQAKDIKELVTKTY